LLSLSLYTLVAIDRKNKEASEAALKYFILGAVASGFLLYGFSMVYGLTGTLAIDEISQQLMDAQASSFVFSFALVFITVGIAFKFGAAPFQLWVPDVYQGSSTPITMFIGSVPKFASMAMLIRLLYQSMDYYVIDWQSMLLIMAIISMLLGNITAIAQVKIKRLLAYSAISHVGFIFLGLATGAVTGIASALFYVSAYMLMTLASFGIIIILSNQKKNEIIEINDLAGLAKEKPWMAFLLLITFLSLAGIPPTIGFYAKFSVIQSVIQFGWVWPAVIAIISALIGMYYYLKIIKIAYFDDPNTHKKFVQQQNFEFTITLSINVMAIILIGLFPEFLLDITTLTSILIF
jgi:NADH-quinone oxidoreductase subunit N